MFILCCFVCLSSQVVMEPGFESESEGSCARAPAERGRLDAPLYPSGRAPKRSSKGPSVVGCGNGDVWGGEGGGSEMRAGYRNGSGYAARREVMRDGCGGPRSRDQDDGGDPRKTKKVRARREMSA